MEGKEKKEEQKKSRKSKQAIVSKETELVAGIRRLRKIGGTYYIGVPKEFVEQNKLKDGDQIPFAANHLLKYVPMKEE